MADDGAHRGAAARRQDDHRRPERLPRSRRDDLGLPAVGPRDRRGASVHGQDGVRAQHRATRRHRAAISVCVLLARNEQGVAGAAHAHRAKRASMRSAAQRHCCATTTSRGWRARPASCVSAPIWIDDSPGITLLEMRSKARRLKAEHDIGLVVVDYLQLMQGPPSSENRQQEISQISRSLKALAKELDVPVIALSQLSRAPEQRTGEHKRPQLSDLRESGAIEQDADVVMFIYRPEVYDGPDATDKDGNPARGPRGDHRRQAAQRADRHRAPVLPQAVHALRELHGAYAGRVSPRTKTVYRCTECGAEHPKWAGRCDALRRVEHARGGDRLRRAPRRAARARRRAGPAASPRAAASRARSAWRGRRAPSRGAGAPASNEFDFVLGGGIVPGSMVLVGGEPGIGKCTLLLQVAARLAAGGAQDALRERRGIAAAGEAARGPARRERRRRGAAERDAARDDPRDRRRGDGRRAALVVDSIQTVFTG